MIRGAAGWMQGAAVLLAGALALGHGAGRAQLKQQLGDVEIAAQDGLEYDMEKRQYIFTGSVTLTSEHSRMLADRMTVQVTPRKELEWAKCEGRVRIEKKDPEAGTQLTGRAERLSYDALQEQATLEGGVVLEQSSPRLARPAVLTGARVETDMKSGKNTVHRGPAAQARVHLEPKGEPGKPPPPPVELTADRIEMNGRTQEYLATGKPVMLRPRTRLASDRLSFQVDPTAMEVRLARADGSVVFESQGENGSSLRASGDRGTFDRETGLLTLVGNVKAAVKDADGEEPSEYEGGELLYNTRTGYRKLSQNVRVRLPAEKQPDAKKPDPKQADPKKPEKPEKKTERQPGNGDRQPEGKRADP